jgi:hypothetical protein
MLRPASWLALLSRTFTFELSLAGSPRANVEYDYVGKLSIPTTGLSPASPTALWAAVQSLTPRPWTDLTPWISCPASLCALARCCPDLEQNVAKDTKRSDARRRGPARSSTARWFPARTRAATCRSSRQEDRRTNIRTRWRRGWWWSRASLTPTRVHRVVYESVIVRPRKVRRVVYKSVIVSLGFEALDGHRYAQGDADQDDKDHHGSDRETYARNPHRACPRCSCVASRGCP